LIRNTTDNESTGGMTTEDDVLKLFTLDEIDDVLNMGG
jgi:hypothetical protein